MREEKRRRTVRTMGHRTGKDNKDSKACAQKRQRMEKRWELSSLAHGQSCTAARLLQHSFLAPPPPSLDTGSTAQPASQIVLVQRRTAANWPKVSNPVNPVRAGAPLIARCGQPGKHGRRKGTQAASIDIVGACFVAWPRSGAQWTIRDTRWQRHEDMAATPQPYLCHASAVCPSCSKNCAAFGQPKGEIYRGDIMATSTHYEKRVCKRRWRRLPEMGGGVKDATGRQGHHP